MCCRTIGATQCSFCANSTMMALSQLGVMIEYFTLPNVELRE
jgi:hypothetical protein